MPAWVYRLFGFEMAPGRELDKPAWDAMLSVRSAPFNRHFIGRVAVKIITTTGQEMTVTHDLV